MTLGFSKHKEGLDTLFMEKILWPYNTTIQKKHPNLLPKIHTFRQGNRWKPGHKMHMVYYNRSKNRLQFNEGIPELEYCKSVQDCTLEYNPSVGFSIFVHDMEQPGVEKELTEGEIQLFAANDGFDSLDQLIDWFFPEYEFSTVIGQIIHFTDFKY